MRSERDLTGLLGARVLIGGEWLVFHPEDVVFVFKARRPARWSDRVAEYKRLRAAGVSRVHSFRWARHLVEVAA